MKRTCIIGGGKSGSQEHIFPAALGGRRTNKHIYCGKHNNEYSPLASILSQQFKFFNALLGIRGDHSDEPHTFKTVDSASGIEVDMGRDRIEFGNPQPLPIAPASGVQQVRFSSEEQIQKYIRDQAALGIKVKMGTRSPVQSYYLSETNAQLMFGGPEALRAIGYVALTFIAHHYPDIARRAELKAFKDYTLGATAKGEVWWDWEPSVDVTDNTFDFGHRIIVGQDASSGVVYGRVSLFSALHFAVVFGEIPGVASSSVVVDIDPLAKKPPHDIRNTPAATAVGRPDVPTVTTSVAIRDGLVQKALNDLAIRIGERLLDDSVAVLLERIQEAEKLDTPSRERLFSEVALPFSQRILNVMRDVAAQFSTQHPEATEIAERLRYQVAANPSALNGLSDAASESLAQARAMLVAQMLKDQEEGILDRRRLKSLFGGALGKRIIAGSIMEPIMRSSGAA
jgi:hypothetical protein